MGEQDIRALEHAIGSLMETISRQTTELRKVMAPLEKLPEFVKESNQITQQGLSDLQMITVQLKLAEITSELEGHEQLLRSEQEALEEKVNELKKDVERISERYKKIMRDLDEDATSRVRSLDAPVLNLLERFFPATVQERYANILLPGRGSISYQAQTTLVNRQSIMETMVEKMYLKIKSFLSSRTKVEDFISQQLVSDQASQRQTYMVPVMLTKKSGKTHIRLLAEHNNPEHRDEDRKKIEQLIEGAIDAGKINVLIDTDEAKPKIIEQAFHEIAETTDDLKTRNAALMAAECFREGKIAISGAHK